MLKFEPVVNDSKRLILAQHLQKYTDLIQRFQLIRFHCFLIDLQHFQKVEVVKNYQRYAEGIQSPHMPDQHQPPSLQQSP